MTAAAAPTLPFDPTDLALRADPHSVYGPIRERAPIARLGENAWIVTGYDEVRAAMRDPGIEAPASSYSPPGTDGPPSKRLDARRVDAAFVHRRGRADHLRLRRILRPAFGQGRLESLRAEIQRSADAHVDRALAAGGFDAVTDLALPVAFGAVADLLGIPAGIRPVLSRDVQGLAGLLDLVPEPTAGEMGRVALAATGTRLRELLAEGRPDPPLDAGLLWALDDARRRGELSEDEVLAQGVMLMFAGHVTTRHLVALGLLAFMESPDQWELLRDRPELTGSAVEELLRFTSPVTAVPRRATADVTLGGETVPAGDGLLVILAAANRDPAVFPDAERLDLARAPNPHIAFGHDAHYCVGAALGRLEAEVVFPTLVRRMPLPRLAGAPIEWAVTIATRGPASLPLVLD